MPTITPTTPSRTIDILASPAHNITPGTSASASISPTTGNSFSISPTNTSFIADVAANTSTIIGDIAVQPDININIGISTLTSTPYKLNSFQYTFSAFEITSPSNYTPGDVVYFKQGSNDYSADIGKADTTTLSKGAYNNLWMFISYSTASRDLVLMQKGYFDFTPESTNFGTWEVGRTIYLNASGQLDILPSATSTHWVKSLGYCIPNKDNKYRVWFESDSTYLKMT